MSGLTAPPLVLRRSVSSVPNQINSCLSADLDLLLDPDLLRPLASGYRLWLSLRSVILGWKSIAFARDLGPGRYIQNILRQIYPRTTKPCLE